ncbi:MAG: hypothetical protein LBT64_03275 [Puniceicoccales bacterium]|nr:hypothetical protein [Puniceicoccales bacterium]
MNKIDIGGLPIKIVSREASICGGSVKLSIGNIPAAIIEPKARLLEEGIVALYSPSEKEEEDWDLLIRCMTKAGETLRGCTKDLRIVEIASKMLRAELSDRDVGTVYAPLKKKTWR